MKAILTAAWAAVLFVTSLPASATPPEFNTRSVRVDYSDLDLTGVHGASTLQRRVAGAVHQVCDGPAFALSDKMQQQACERTAGTAASKEVQGAITNARKLSSTKPVSTSASGIADKAISNFGHQPWIGNNRIPRR